MDEAAMKVGGNDVDVLSVFAITCRCWSPILKQGYPWQLETQEEGSKIRIAEQVPRTWAS